MAINKNFGYKTNLAYNSNLAYKEPRQLEKTNHIKKIKTKHIKKIRPAAFIFLLAITSLILCFYIANLSKGTELAFKINAKKNQYEIQKSENVRLHSVLETTYLNATEIEKYAKLNLGMRKQNNSQINYVNVPKKRLNKMNNFKSQTNSKQNVLDKIKNIFTKTFG